MDRKELEHRETQLVELADSDRVLQEVYAERERQVTVKGWTGDRDDAHNSMANFALYIGTYCTKWFKGGYPQDAEKSVPALREFRMCMIKVAALAVAAVQWADRKIENSLDTPDIPF